MEIEFILKRLNGGCVEVHKVSCRQDGSSWVAVGETVRVWVEFLVQCYGVNAGAIRWRVIDGCEGGVLCQGVGFACGKDSVRVGLLGLGELFVARHD